ELHRRLKQVAVAEEDEGQLLAVGQRLVTRDGRLRRWDGFVATGSGAAAAERLIRANRHAQLAAELPEFENAVEVASAERDRELSSAAAREQSEWRKRQADAEQRLASALERQKQQAAERAQLQQEPAELDAKISELEHANDESQVRIGEATASELEAEAAVV